jgi:hypothetical protein
MFTVILKVCKEKGAAREAKEPVKVVSRGVLCINHYY